MNIEFHQTFVSHFQEQGLASFLIHHIGAFHDLVDFERLLAERAEDIFSIIQHALVVLSQKVARFDFENQLFEKIQDWRARC